MEKKGVGRPRDGNPEETRREILAAASEAFAAAGYVGATTRAVASRAGVNVATLHYHFGSKEGLYRAVLEAAGRGTLPNLPPGDAAETVARVVEALFRFGEERPDLARLALLDALAEFQFDVAIGGARRDEEKARAKERVFVTNSIRALRKVSPTDNVRDIDFVVLVGGSALDFEIPQLVTHALAEYRVVAGRANIRGTEGARNAVATGLALSWAEEQR